MGGFTSFVTCHVFTYLSYCDLSVTSILQAIEFAMEEGDDELWDILIRLSIVNPSKRTNDNIYEGTYMYLHTQVNSQYTALQYCLDNAPLS